MDVAVKDMDRHVMAGAVEEEERPADRVAPVAVMVEDETQRTNDRQTTKPPITSMTTTEVTTMEQVTTKVTTTTTEETASKVKEAITTVKQHTAPPVFCDITNGDAVSAITRASSVACKNMIKNVTCLAQEGKLYNMDIPNLCTLGTDPGVVVESLSFSRDPSSSVRILFLLSLHGRSARQVKRLFKAIYHSNHYYYIHVDSVKLSYIVDCAYIVYPCRDLNTSIVK